MNPQAAATSLEYRFNLSYSCPRSLLGGGAGVRVGPVAPAQWSRSRAGADVLKRSHWDSSGYGSL